MPEIRRVHASASQLIFHADEAAPYADVSIDLVNDLADVDIQWSALDGVFAQTGGSSASGARVRWQAPKMAGDYPITVVAAIGASRAVDSVVVSLEPSLRGYWADTLSVAEGTFEFASTCLWFLDDFELEMFNYSEWRNEPYLAHGTGGSPYNSEYLYPSLTSNLASPDLDDFDEPLSLSGSINGAGTVITVDVLFERDTHVDFVLERPPGGSACL